MSIPVMVQVYEKMGGKLDPGQAFALGVVRVDKIDDLASVIGRQERAVAVVADDPESVRYITDHEFSDCTLIMVTEPSRWRDLEGLDSRVYPVFTPVSWSRLFQLTARALGLAPRHVVHLAGRVRISGADAEPVHGCISDLSLSGIRLLTEAPLPPRLPVTLEFYLPTSLEAVVLPCEVIRPYPGNYYGMEFQGGAGAGILALSSYLERLDTARKTAPDILYMTEDPPFAWRLVEAVVKSTRKFVHVSPDWEKVHELNFSGMTVVTDVSLQGGAPASTHQGTVVLVGEGQTIDPRRPSETWLRGLGL